MSNYLNALYTTITLFALPLMATAQAPVSVNGPDSVCKNSRHTYNISSSPGIFYQWEVTVHGIILSVSGGQASVSWNGAGAATLRVKGYNTAAQLEEEGSLTVYVAPPPEPVITWNNHVGCQVANPLSGEAYDSLNVDIRDGSCLRVCEGSTVTYKTDNAAGGHTYNWQASGGTVAASAGDSCIITWDTAGYGSLAVTETTPQGCSTVRQICIEIIAAPKARFSTLNETYGDSLSCITGPVYFLDKSVDNGSPIVSWLWNFGYGNSGHKTSNLQNPMHPAMDGLGEVTLTVTNECNCSGTVTRTIDVSPQPGAKIDCITPVCENGNGQYFWQGCVAALSVIGGTIVYEYGGYYDVIWDQIDSTGFGYLYFSDGDCFYCTNPIAGKVPVIQQHGYIQGPRVVCPGGKQYRFQLPQWPATVFKWSVQSATGAFLIPTDQPNEYLLRTDQPGAVTINVVYQNTLLGCGGTATVEIDVQEPVAIDGPVTICAGKPAIYTAYNAVSSSPVPGVWTLRGPGGYIQTNTGTSINASFPLPGIYTLSIVNSAYCSPDPLIITVPALLPLPDTLAGPDTVCLHTPYTFNIKNARPDAVFRWAAEGGAISGSSTGNEVNVVFTASNGPYRIKVWREQNRTPFCTSDTLAHTLYPSQVSLSVAGPDTACSNTYQPYNAGYRLGETYEWTVYPATIGSVASGDGSPGVEVLWNQISIARYADLVVKMRKCGVTYTDTLKVWVTPAPTVSIAAADSVCREEQFFLSLTASPALTSWTAIIWDFGDGNGATGPTPNHTYTTLNQQNAAYTVTVTVTGPNGCFANATAAKSIIVKPAPVANVTPSGPFEFCDTSAINTALMATIQSGFGATDAVTWYRNGIAVSAGGAGNVSYTALMTGAYRAVVSNSNACSAATNIVSVTYKCPDTCRLPIKPEVTIGGGLTACGTVDLTGSYTSGGFNPSWIWPAQATPVSTTATTGSFTFDQAGNYAFIYTVSYDNGAGDTCRVSDRQYRIVPYIAGLKYNVSCGSTPGTYSVTLQDHSNYYPQTPISNWTFYIDGTPYQSGSQTSYTTSLMPGTYQLALRITGGSYPECWDYATLELPALPVANFTYHPDTLPACVGTPVSFTSLSTPAGLAHHWDFGDLAGNLQHDPERVFELPPGGTRNVILTVTNIYGCSDDTFRTVSIVPNELLGGFLDPPLTDICKGNPVSLNYNSGTSIGLPETYYWQNDLDTFIITTSSPINAFSSGGYWVTTTNQYGCIASTPVVAVDFINIPDAIINGDTRYCEHTSFTLYGYAGPDIASYYWYRDGNLIAAGSIPDLEEPGLSAGTYEYRLAITVARPGGGYCTDTSAPFTVTIGSRPPDPVISYTMQDCSDYTLQLEGANTVPGHFTWSNGMSGSPVLVNHGGPYKLYFTDTNGCVTTAETDIPKDPETYMWIFPAADCYRFCYADTLGILQGPVIPFEEWSWNIGTGGSGSGPVPPSAFNGGGGNLFLDNGLCWRTSEDMSMQIDYPCDCQIKGCNEEKESETDIKICLEYISVIYNPDNSCVNEGEIYIACDLPLTVTITSADGIFLPSSFYNNFSANYYTVQFIPNAGFNGGLSPLTIKTYIHGEWTHCIKHDTFYFPEPLCTQPHLKPSRPADTIVPRKRPAAKTYTADGSFLKLAPNPASGSTRILYHYAGNLAASGRVIEIYDLTGRLLKQVPATGAEGSIDLDISHFATALYMVVLKEEGRVTAYQKLQISGN